MAPVSDLPEVRLALARLGYASGLTAGRAEILATSTGARLAITLSGVSEGKHGVHLQ